MSDTALHVALGALEVQLERVSSWLLEGAADGLPEMASELQSLSLQAGRLLATQALQATDVARMRAVGLGIGRLREHLARRQALVDQALAMLLPATVPSVYSSVSGPYGAGGAKASGRFQSLSA